jgi:hypothetical protein
MMVAVIHCIMQCVVLCLRDFGWQCHWQLHVVCHSLSGGLLGTGASMLGGVAQQVYASCLLFYPCDSFTLWQFT